MWLLSTTGSGDGRIVISSDSASALSGSIVTVASMHEPYTNVPQAGPPAVYPSISQPDGVRLPLRRLCERRRTGPSLDRVPSAGKVVVLYDFPVT